MWDMSLHKFVHRAYQISRNIARSTGQIDHMRVILGPLIGRFVFKMAPDVRGTFLLNGQHMILAGVDRYPPIDMAMGNFEARTVELIENVLRPGMNMVDVGAHVGYFSLLAASLVGESGRIFAFEPEPENYQILIGNIERNGYETIVVEQKAISQSLGEVQLFISGLDNGSHSIYQNKKRRTTGFVTVPTITLDSFIELHGSPDLDLIKIDVEGAEIDVINGMQRILERLRPPALLIEFCPFLLQAAGKLPIDLIRLIRRWGFVIQYIDENVGVLPLDESVEDHLIETLLKHQTYVNIFCTK